MKTKETLAKLFTTVKRTDDTEVRTFTPEAMTEGNEAYATYRAVSDAMQAGGLTFDFSYRVADKAVDILVELEDWEDGDAISEAIDSAIPVYNQELMTIYADNSSAVDEVREELGSEGNSTQLASQAWYNEIQKMVEAIKNNLTE